MEDIMDTQNNIPTWEALLKRAVNEPGLVSKAYSRFHDYSCGNQMLAIEQCWIRKIDVGPIATYPKWKALGRHVKAGEKAIVLCMPVTMKRSEKKTDGEGREVEEDHVFTRFVYRPNWFVLAQTEGAEYQAPPVPGWDKAKALQALSITEIPFDHADGNTQGFARAGGKVSINTVAELPHKTLFHELGHHLLGHLEESGYVDNGDKTPRNLREAEAEAVALLCCESLGLPGAEFSRGYIQHWYGHAEIPDKSAQKIFKAADRILKAGRIDPA
jgi:antirestriction protein ArdC